MKVAIIKDESLDYCRHAPYHPGEKYPEYPFNDTCSGNGCYGQVRGLLHKLGMDPDHYGTPSWNPLGEIIRPGDHVFIKPNFVTHRNSVGGTDAVITQGSVIRPMVDYASIALKGEGIITIGDAPYINTDFDEVARITGIGEIADYYEKSGAMKIRIVDLRKEQGAIRLGHINKVRLQGDPLGYTAVDLNADSAHYGSGEDPKKFRVVYYDKQEMSRHHTENKNEYCIANSILDADVVISLPKMKTHGKTGMSCALKNLVGINGVKDWLPHHMAGSAEEGGDEYMRRDLRKGLFIRLRDDSAALDHVLLLAPVRAICAMLFVSKAVVPFSDSIEGGSWFGNHTLPRTIADLNKILFYADKKGVMQDTMQRKEFIMVDGITAGEKEGPMSNSAKKCGVLMAGYNPVEVDIACSMAMGFDPERILAIREASDTKKYPIFTGDPRDIEIISDRCKAIDGVYDAFNCALVPPKGWVGHIEYRPVLSPAIESPAMAMPLRH